MEKLVVKVHDEVRRYIHNDISNAAHYLKGKIEERSKNNDRAGIGLEIMACLTMTAFAFEAQINFLGYKLIENWKEHAPYFYKYQRVARKLKFTVDETQEPHSTIKELVKFRNTLAHGKPIEINVKKEITITREELDKRDILKGEWENYLTEKFLATAYRHTDET